MDHIGLILSCYNRPIYLKQCLESISRCTIPENLSIVIVDDASTLRETLKLIEEFNIGSANTLKIIKDQRKGICHSLLLGAEHCWRMDCDYVINLDSDAIVRNDFFQTLMALKKHYPNQIVTGFHSTTRNANGTERHEIVGYYGNAYAKKSVGGINMCFDRYLYKKYVEPSLQKSFQLGYNWDNVTSIACMDDGFPIISVKKSILQHLGIHSAMGHTSGIEQPDTGEGFKPYALNNVTLIGVDCVSLKRLIRAAEISCAEIEFAEVKLLSSLEPIQKDFQKGWDFYKIPHIASKEAYSTFVMKEIYKYVETEYMLIFQYDGYVIKAAAWSSDFLQYDMIGGSWWFTSHNCGNGGFSLRSRKLMNILAKDEKITHTHPEDHQIGRVYRQYLEMMYDIKFAPDEICDRFSIENHNRPNKLWTGQFGFHSNSIILPKDKKLGI